MVIINFKLDDELCNISKKEFNNSQQAEHRDGRCQRNHVILSAITQIPRAAADRTPRRVDAVI